MFSKVLAIFTTALMLASSPALADWAASAVSQGQTGPGATAQVDCPPGGAPGPVWGTGTYTSDSSICGAAQHYGWFAPGGGGVVTYQTVPGLPAYQGTTQNAVTTGDYGQWTLSFQITGIAPIAGGGAAPNFLTVATWTTTLDEVGFSTDVGSAH